MFDNIGGKIKGLAIIITAIGILGSVVGGIVMFTIDEDLIAIGLVVMIVGPLVSWISSFMLYGFGQLVQNSDILTGRITSEKAETSLVSNLLAQMRMYKRDANDGYQDADGEYESGTDAPDIAERLAMLEKLYANGVISQEAYQAKYTEILKEASLNDE